VGDAAAALLQLELLHAANQARACRALGRPRPRGSARSCAPLTHFLWLGSYTVTAAYTVAPRKARPPKNSLRDWACGARCGAMSAQRGRGGGGEGQAPLYVGQARPIAAT
jgi:hypothetical protein